MLDLPANRGFKLNTDYDVYAFGGKKLKNKDVSEATDRSTILEIYIGGNPGFASSYRVYGFPSVEKLNDFLATI
jgi:hypothetical protein